MPTELPDRPWQRVGTDLFELGGKIYLLAVDYFSRFVEIAWLNKTKSNDVTHLKSFFARHGIPEVLISDNGPQFSSQFSWTLLQHMDLNTPQAAQGFHKAMEQTVKNLLKKAADPHLALLAYSASERIQPSSIAYGSTPAFDPFTCNF